MLQSTVRDVQEQIKDLRQSREIERKEEVPVEGGDVDLLDDRVNEILKKFPLKSLDDFNKFEEQLKSDQELRNSTVSIFYTYYYIYIYYNFYYYPNNNDII